MHDVSGASTTLVNNAPPAQAGFDTLINVAPEGQPKAVLAAWRTDADNKNNASPLSAEEIAYYDKRFQDVSWNFLEKVRARYVWLRTSNQVGGGIDVREQELDAIEAKYYPKEFAALLIERAKIRAQNEADFKAMGVPSVEAMRPDALLTNLAPNSSPDKGQIPLKPTDVKALPVQTEKPGTNLYPPMIIEDIHPARDAIKTNLPQGGQ